MIVNTTVFNYRLTLGALIVAILVLATFGFTNYQDLQSDYDYLSHEKKLLQKELSEFINEYDSLGSENESLKSRFETTSAQAKLFLDSLNSLKADVSVLARFKKELFLLKKQNSKLKADSLAVVINDLKTTNSKLSESSIETEKLAAELREENEILKKTLRKASVLKANSIEAKGFRFKNSGEPSETNKASQAEFIEVCFVLAENPLIKRGEKKLFLQILSPDGNVLNDAGVAYYGISSLIYSKSFSVRYEQLAQEFCAEVPNDESFVEGLYYVSIFHEDKLLGTTQIQLD